MIKPPHPGETIREDYLVPLGMSVIDRCINNAIMVQETSSCAKAERKCGSPVRPASARIGVAEVGLVSQRGCSPDSVCCQFRNAVARCLAASWR